MTKETISFTPIEMSEEYSRYPQIDLRLQKQVTTPYTNSTIIYAQNEQGQRVVVKIFAVDGALREWEGLNRTYNAGLSVPKPYALVKDSANKTGVILEYVDGKSLYNQQSDQGRHSFGALIHRMHQLTPISSNEWIRSQKYNFDYFQQNLLTWGNSQIEELTDKGRSQAILSLLAGQARSHCEAVIPVFNHNDLHDGQTIVSGKSVTLIDFEKWIEDSPLNDIAIYIFHSIRNAQSRESFEHFLKGYLGETSFSEVEKSSLMFYLLFISSRALNHFYQQGNPYVEISKTTHKNILKYAESESLWKNF